MDSEQLRLLKRIGAVKKQLGTALQSTGGTVSGGLSVKDALTAAGGMKVTGGINVSGQVKAAGPFSAGNGRLTVPADSAEAVTIAGLLEAGDGRLVVPSDSAEAVTITGRLEAGDGRLVVPSDSAEDITIDGNGIWHTGNLEVETGPWTPTLYGATTAGSPTYSYRVGVYTRTGDIVVVHFSVSITAIGGMSGRIRISGLPYATSLGDQDNESFISAQGVTAPNMTDVFGRFNGGSAYVGVMVRTVTSGAIGYLYCLDTYLSTSSVIKGTLSYRAA